MQDGKNTPCRCSLLITEMLFLPECLVSAEQQRNAIRAEAISAGQRGLEDGQAALGARQHEGRKNRELRAWAALSRHRLVQL